MIAVLVALALVLAPPAVVDASPPATREDGLAVEPEDDAPPVEEPLPPSDEPTVDDAPPPPDDAPPPRPTRAGASEPHPSVVGGYWDMDRTKGPEPKDGQDQIIAGSILVPLGLVSVSSSAATVWLSAPGACVERWKSVGASPTAAQCKGLRTFGIIRVTYGSLMVISGAVLLAIGLQRREKHRRWEQSLSLAPWFGNRSGGLAYSGRFGGRRW